MNEVYSKIKVREKQKPQKVKIGSQLKPEIITPVINKWQTLIDAAAEIVDVPSALIMKLHEDSIEVFLKSNNKTNPYKKGEKAKLIYGLYCETVIGTQNKLLVPDATKSKLWKDNNPDIDINMISYLGFPVNWPDGEVFGTVCLLDNKENHYKPSYSEYLHQIKQHIETDLKLLVTNQELKEKSNELEQLNHIKSRFLSLISHDVRGAVGTLDTFLKLLILKSDDIERDQLKQSLESLRQSANSTYLTLESLLKWSKQDLLQLEAKKRKFNIIPVVESIIKYFNDALEFKELKVTKEYDSDKLLITADKNMMETAIRNIISNAINYTSPKGTITIRLLTRKNNHSIEIEDTGIGMSKDSVKNLFTYRKSNKNNSGAGIGLIITKDFLDKNGASVKVTSELGKGTKFEISI